MTNVDETFSSDDKIDDKSAQNLSRPKKLDRANNLGVDTLTPETQLVLKLG